MPRLSEKQKGFIDLLGLEVPTGTSQTEVRTMIDDELGRRHTERLGEHGVPNELRVAVRHDLGASPEYHRLVGAFVRDFGLRPGCIVQGTKHDAPSVVLAISRGFGIKVRRIGSNRVSCFGVLFRNPTTEQYEGTCRVIFSPPKTHVHAWTVSEKEYAHPQNDRFRAFVAERLAPEARITTEWGEFWNVAEVEALREAFAAR